MHAVQSSKPQKCTPNLLPVQLNHNGPIKSTDRFWKPEKDDKGKQHVYFRGRHLTGTSLPLPPRYTGAVLRTTDEVLPARSRSRIDDIYGENGDREDEEDEEAEMTVETTIVETIGEFDEVVIWAHGGEVDQERDMYVRGMREWIGFAEAMHENEDTRAEAHSKEP